MFQVPLHEFIERTNWSDRCSPTCFASIGRRESHQIVTDDGNEINKIRGESLRQTLDRPFDLNLKLNSLQIGEGQVS